ncbi:MAG: hypothetical protein AAGE38_17680 [Pseudomonadota bacterium]
MGTLIKSGFVIQGSVFLPTFGVIDTEYYGAGGNDYLIIASEGIGSISVYDITDADSVVLASLAAQTANSGTATLSDLVLVPGDGGTFLLPLGRNDDNFALFDIGPSGILSIETVLTDASDIYERGFVGESIKAGSSEFFITSAFGRAGMEVFELNPDNSVTFVRRVEDSDFRKLEDVTAIHATTIFGRATVFTGSGLDTGLHSFWFSGIGNMGVTDRKLTRGTEGMRGITDIDSVQIDDRAFVVVAAAGSDSLQVFRVSFERKLTLLDTTRDTGSTRFDNVQAMEVFESNDRVFVLAGGSDDGVTLYEMTFRGKLLFLETFVDGFDTALKSVSSIEVRVEGDTAYAYVGSLKEGGVTELIIDLERSGEDIRGGPVKDQLTGTSQDDIIWGFGKSDQIDGGAGDDRLIDGRGRDTLTGGPGADIFEFVADGRSDFILDFDPAVDKIDLTDTSANAFSDLLVGARIRGAVVKIDDEIIRLRNPEGTPYDVSEFTADTFIF